MKRRLLSLLLVLIMIAAAVPFPAMAVTAPTTIDAPEHFGVGHYQGDSFYYTFSAPESLISFLEASGTRYVINAQLDYKLGDGNWHYTSSWDTAKYTLKNTRGFSYVLNESYISGGREKVSVMFPEDSAALQPIKDSSWNIPPQALSFRIRFVTSFDGNKTFIYSDWSNTYVYSKDVVKDPDALINHAPTIVSAEIKKNSGGQPILYIRTARQPGEVQDLNSMVSGAMRTEIWLKKAGDTDFKRVGDNFFSNQYMPVSVTNYFDKNLQSYDAESYEIKIRYVLNDLRKYPQLGRSETIYSPFSNIYSQNMPSWSSASKWATGELAKADELGMIPDILKGADMTKPITREEFAELGVKLYEITTKKASTPVDPNPFTDTTNPQILKAFNLGITAGTSTTTFSPKVLITREQCAAMLFRAIKAIVPNGNFSTEGVADFPDQKDISGYAVPATKFMFKIKIITGDAQGRFMPKATTTAQSAANYGMATREQAIAMSVRTYDIYK